MKFISKSGNSLVPVSKDELLSNVDQQFYYYSQQKMYPIEVYEIHNGGIDGIANLNGESKEFSVNWAQFSNKIFKIMSKENSNSKKLGIDVVLFLSDNGVDAISETTAALVPHEDVAKAIIDLKEAVLTALVKSGEFENDVIESLATELPSNVEEVQLGAPHIVFEPHPDDNEAFEFEVILNEEAIPSTKGVKKITVAEKAAEKISNLFSITTEAIEEGFLVINMEEEEVEVPLDSQPSEKSSENNDKESVSTDSITPLEVLSMYLMTNDKDEQKILQGIFPNIFTTEKPLSELTKLQRMVVAEYKEQV